MAKGDRQDQQQYMATQEANSRGPLADTRAMISGNYNQFQPYFQTTAGRNLNDYNNIMSGYQNFLGGGSFGGGQSGYTMPPGNQGTFTPGQPAPTQPPIRVGTQGGPMYNAGGGYQPAPPGGYQQQIGPNTGVLHPNWINPYGGGGQGMYPLLMNMNNGMTGGYNPGGSGTNMSLKTQLPGGGIAY